MKAIDDHQLTLSPMFGNCWAKPLKRERIVEQLFSCQGQLQTAALLCGEEEILDISKKLFAAGVTRITDGETMSVPALGESHDGIEVLRCYTKVCTITI